MGEAMLFLADALRDLFDREPHAGVAVLARFSQQAEDAYQALKRCDLDFVRRVRHQDFSFGPGVEVTDIGQTKGLEFDYVIVLNCDEESFPETNSARHQLHVAMTRAAHQLWLLSWKSPSRLLPDSLRLSTGL
jgi:DNA helicase-2/ATP-dependent DNA helicase PcrA